MIKKRAARLLALLAITLAPLALLAPSPAQAAPPPYGGDLLTNDQYDCTAGVPMRSASGQWYIVTAGHCLGNRPTGNWMYGLNLPIGTGARWEFGPKGPDGSTSGWDAGAIRANKPLSAQVRSQSAIYNLTGWRNPIQGDRVCIVFGKSRNTGCGLVTVGLETGGVLVNGGGPLGQQRISNLARVVIDNGNCPVGGDSGGPALVGTVAVGFVSAAGGCTVFITRLAGVAQFYQLTF